MLYLLLSFYLLPALAVTLKVRKRKLSEKTITSDSSTLVDNTNSVTDATKSLVMDANSKLGSLDSINTGSQNTLSSKLNLLALQTEAYRQFNFSVVGQAQLTAIFFI